MHGSRFTTLIVIILLSLCGYFVWGIYNINSNVDVSEDLKDCLYSNYLNYVDFLSQEKEFYTHPLTENLSDIKIDGICGVDSFSFNLNRPISSEDLLSTTTVYNRNLDRMRYLLLNLE